MIRLRTRARASAPTRESAAASAGPGTALGALEMGPLPSVGRVREHPWSRGAIVVRVATILCLLIGGSATWFGGAAPPLLLVLGILALGGIAVLRPESPAGAVVLLLVLWWWTVADVPTWQVGAAIALPFLVAAHVLLTVASLTPPFVPLDPDVLRLWAGRAGRLTVAGWAVLAVGWAASGAPVGWTIAGLALIASLATALALTQAYLKDEPAG